MKKTKILVHLDKRFLEREVLSKNVLDMLRYCGVIQTEPNHPFPEFFVYQTESHNRGEQQLARWKSYLIDAKVI